MQKLHSNLKGFLLLSLLIFLAQSCEKDDSPIVSDDPINIEGRFSNYISCDIIAVPTGVGLNSYYTKYLNCTGIPVIAPSSVPDEALYIASETTEFMLTGLANVRTKLVNDGNYIALYPEGGSLTDLPEPFVGSAVNDGAYTWQGPGPNDLRAVANDAGSILCLPGAPAGHVLVHEIAHMIHIGGLRLLNNSFENELTAIYNQSMSGGNWSNTYGTTNRAELLAEAVTIYYGVNWIGPEGGNGSRNNIGTRAELQAKDPTLYNFINTHFYNGTNLPGCRRPVIAGTTANCPATVTDIDGNVYEVVNIGSMCWMKENLKTTRYRDGSPITQVTDNTEWVNTSTGAWANYDNNPDNDAIYGKLYNGYALKSEKLCPEGWRAPTLQDLQDMVNYAGGDHAAVNLRGSDFWEPGLPPSNSSNFTALPSGTRNGNGGFFQAMGRETFFGSKSISQLYPSKLYTKNIFYDQEIVYTGDGQNTSGVSCRCIKE